MTPNPTEPQAGEELRVAALNDELLEIARSIEGLKRECGMDPETPTAVQNGRYMTIANRVRALARTPSPIAADGGETEGRAPSVPCAGCGQPRECGLLGCGREASTASALRGALHVLERVDLTNYSSAFCRQVDQAVETARRILASSTPAAPASQEGAPAAWINYPALQVKGEFVGYGTPDVSFERQAGGYSWNKSEPLYRRAAPQAAAEPADGGEPYAYAIHIDAQQRIELVHSLDDAVDELTNCDCEVVKLYTESALRAAIEADRRLRTQTVAEDNPELPYEYLLAKCAMVVPLLQEARDALTALRETDRLLNDISATLADRMDIAGTFSLEDWREHFPDRAATPTQTVPAAEPGEPT